jgi:hypothetical protein
LRFIDNLVALRSYPELHVGNVSDTKVTWREPILSEEVQCIAIGTGGFGGVCGT